jgi:penicillin-binding protein 1A
MVVIAAAWGGMLGAFVWYIDDAKTTIDALEEYRPKIGSKVYSSDGELLGEFTTAEVRQLINLNEIPLNLQKAFVATEDKLFFEHKGVNPFAIMNAALYIIQTGQLRGGSTITQQLARNVETLRVGEERTLKRKLSEAVTALQIEREYTKDEILELYLNQIFLGISAYGVEAAAHQYFGKSCRDLTLGECAMLAGLTRAPNLQEPIHNPENALTRRDIVLKQMFTNNFITQEEFDAALAERLEDSVITTAKRAEMEAKGEGVWSPNKFKAPYFVEEVRKQLAADPSYTEEEMYGEGLEFHTTLDWRVQQAAEEKLLTALDEFDARKLESLKRNNKENEFVPVSGALICLDNRPGSEGFVRALVGGRDYENNKFNTVTQARRQPGSSVKPFVWAAALDSGKYSPSTLVMDSPFVTYDGLNRAWRPRNFSGDFAGPVTLRYALQKSINIVSVRLVDDLGMPLVRSYLESAGIETPISSNVGLTIALGSPVVSPLEHCVAYSTLAKNGMWAPATMVLEAKNRDGFQRAEKFAPETEPRIAPEVAYSVAHLLKGVAFYGTGYRGTKIMGDRPRGGKTGTTNDSRDAWFCGFTKHLTTIVWVGYRDNRSLGRGNRYTGGALACPVWGDFMKDAHDILGLPEEDFDVPEGVKWFGVDMKTGVRGGKFREAFIRGMEPPIEQPDLQFEEDIHQQIEDELLNDIFEPSPLASGERKTFF